MRVFKKRNITQENKAVVRAAATALGMDVKGFIEDYFKRIGESELSAECYSAFCKGVPYGVGDLFGDAQRVVHRTRSPQRVKQKFIRYARR